MDDADAACTCPREHLQAADDFRRYLDAGHQPRYSAVVYREVYLPRSSRATTLVMFHDATIRQLDARHGLPGAPFAIYATRLDPETGEATDCDGDAARLFISMDAGASYVDGDCVIVEGFVEAERYSGAFRRERWTMTPRAWELEQLERDDADRAGA